MKKREMSEKTRLRLLKLLKFITIVYFLTLAFVIAIEGFSIKIISDLIKEHFITFLLIGIAYSNFTKSKQ